MTTWLLMVVKQGKWLYYGPFESFEKAHQFYLDHHVIWGYQIVEMTAPE